MAISVVHTTTASALTVTIPSTTAGNCLVVCVMSFGTAGAQSVSSVKLGGAAGNFAALASNAAGANAVFVWADPNCAGGQTSVTITGSGLAVDSADGGVVVYEVSGLVSSSVLDKSSTGESNSGTSWSSGTTATTTQASEIWIGCASTSDPRTGPGSPWTNATPSGSFSIAGFQIVSATGTATYSGTQSGSIDWGAAVVTLKGAATATVSPFAPPAAGRGRPAAVKGTGRGSPRTPVTVFPGSPFTLPVKPSRGAQAAVRGTSKGNAGTFTPPPQPTPSPFTLPVRPARGAQAAVRGRAASSPGARFALIQTSPFTLPRSAARGRMNATRGRGSAGSATGHGAPFVPRKLIVSIASAAGVDDYGTPFVEGVQIGPASNAAQLQLIPTIPDGNAAQIAFAMAARNLSNTPNISGGVIGGSQATDLIISGPALSPAQGDDWVQLVLFSGDGLGDEASMSFRYIVAGGGVIPVANANGSGWTFGVPVTMPALDLNGQTISVPQGQPAAPSAAPSSYNQLWGQDITGVLNAIITVLVNAGIC